MLLEELLELEELLLLEGAGSLSLDAGGSLFVAGAGSLLLDELLDEVEEPLEEADELDDEEFELDDEEFEFDAKGEEAAGATEGVEAGAPLPSVSVASTEIPEETVIASARLPALMTSASMEFVANVAETPSTVASIELPLFVSVTLIVLV